MGLTFKNRGHLGFQVFMGYIPQDCLLMDWLQHFNTGKWLGGPYEALSKMSNLHELVTSNPRCFGAKILPEATTSSEIQPPNLCFAIVAIERHLACR